MEKWKVKCCKYKRTQKERQEKVKMKQEEMFGKAKWLSAGKYHTDQNGDVEKDAVLFPILRGKFIAHHVKKATIRVVGLGFFVCFINGKKVSKDAFLPLSTDYEGGRPPYDEEMTGHRLYVPTYDITALLKEGENSIVVHYGGGWYTYEGSKYGDPKVIYRILMEEENGEKSEAISTEEDRYAPSFVMGYCFTQFEKEDFRNFDDRCYLSDFDDHEWKHAECAKPIETEYLFSDCPADRVAEQLPVTQIGETPEGKVYDCGRNISGFPVLESQADAGETISVVMSEERNADGTLNQAYCQYQHFDVISDGKKTHTCSLLFMIWLPLLYDQRERRAAFGRRNPYRCKGNIFF